MAKEPTIQPPTKKPLEPLEALAREKGISPVILAGVKGFRRWDDLYEVSEDEFAEALRDYQAIRIG